VELWASVEAAGGPLPTEVGGPSLEVVLVRPIPTGTAEIGDVLATGVTEERYEELDEAVVMSC
jgi:hypothetical protein